MPAALLARLGRATAEQVVEHIDERMAAPRESWLPGALRRTGAAVGAGAGLRARLPDAVRAADGHRPGGCCPDGDGSSPAGAGALGAGTVGMGCAMRYGRRGRYERHGGMRWAAGPR